MVTATTNATYFRSKGAPSHEMLALLVGYLAAAEQFADAELYPQSAFRR